MSAAAVTPAYLSFLGADAEPSMDFREQWEAEGMEEGDPEIERKARKLARLWVGEFVVRLASFLVEEGRSKVEGAGIRAFVFAWFVSPRLQGLRQTELAELMARKHKQSVGREVSRFRDFFRVWAPGMQCEAAREKCRAREAAKRVDVEFEANGASDFVPEVMS